MEGAGCSKGRLKWNTLLAVSYDPDSCDVLLKHTWESDCTEGIPVVPSEDEVEYQMQKATGFCKERLGLLKEYGITSEDRVLVFWLKSEYFLNKLFILH